MRAEVIYKGWSIGGKIGVPRHNCPHRKSPRGNYTCMGYVTKTKEVHVCVACGTYMTREIEEYFLAMHKLLIMSGM